MVDAQPPPALARWLSSAGHPAEHVKDLGLERAIDRHIWNYPLQVGAVIISKDEDFVILQSVSIIRPAIVWIRRGNTSRRQLLTWFEVLLPDILRSLENGEDLIEVI